MQSNNANTIQPEARQDKQRGPLSGVKVLEFGHVAAGPFAGMLLADMGADVVKIESPVGDGLREWAPIIDLEDGSDFSLNFASLNRNKRSVMLDVKQDEQLQQAYELISAADVIIENFRPGVTERLGFGFDHISKNINPEIIYCSISGYGSSGPDSLRGAFDLVIQAESGLMDVTGPADGDPVKCGVPIADFVTGQYAAFSIVCALQQRNISRHPVRIDCSMLESTLAISALQTSQYWGTGSSPTRLGSAHPRNAPYQAFRSSDRQFAMAAGNDRLWESVCEIVGNQELAHDPRFVSQTNRVANVTELVEILESYFVHKPARYWVKALGEAGVPCSLINTVAEALDTDQIAHREFVQKLTLPDGSSTLTTALPMHINGRNHYSLSAPPRLGQHTEEVLTMWAPEKELSSEKI